MVDLASPAGSAPGSNARRATPAELLVTRDAITDPLVPQTARIRRSGLPRRTYQTTLQRIQSREWVLERFVPSVAVTGLPLVGFLLAEPAPGERDAIAAEFGPASSTVVCWALGRTLLVVSCARQSGPLVQAAERLQRDGRCPWATALAVPVEGEGIRSYFDFSGEWASYGGLSAPPQYPHGWKDRAPSRRGVEPGPPSPRTLSTVRAMASRGVAAPMDDSGEAGLATRWPMRFVEQNLLRQGWAEARGFLDPMAVAATVRDFAAGITFVAGALRRPGDAQGLASDLFEQSLVRPFLFASDERSALLGFLAAGANTRLAPRPPPHARVRSVLDRHLGALHVTRDPLDSAVTVVNHRYGQLVSTHGRPTIAV